MCTFFSSCRLIYIVNVEVWDLIVSNFDRGPFQLRRDYEISRTISFDIHITWGVPHGNPRVRIYTQVLEEIEEIDSYTCLFIFPSLYPIN